MNRYLNYTIIFKLFMKKNSYLSSNIEKEIVIDNFSKLKTNEMRIELDFKSMEKDVYSTLRNLSLLKKEDIVISKFVREDEGNKKEIELKNVCNFLQDFIISEKMNEKMRLKRNKNQINKKFKLNSTNHIVQNSEIIEKKNYFIQSNTKFIPPIKKIKRNTFQHNNLNAHHQQNKICDISNNFINSMSNCENIKPILKKSSSNFDLGNSQVEFSRKREIKFQKLEETNQISFNKQLDENSKVNINLNKLKSYKNLKYTNKLSQQFQNESNDFYKENVGESITQILFNINQLSKLKLSNSLGAKKQPSNLIMNNKNFQF